MLSDLKPRNIFFSISAKLCLGLLSYVYFILATILIIILHKQANTLKPEAKYMFDIAEDNNLIASHKHIKIHD